MVGNRILELNKIILEGSQNAMGSGTPTTTRVWSTSGRQSSITKQMSRIRDNTRSKNVSDNRRWSTSEHSISKSGSKTLNKCKLGLRMRLTRITLSSLLIWQTKPRKIIKS